jgi:hypothetical protein
MDHWREFDRLYSPVPHHGRAEKFATVARLSRELAGRVFAMLPDSPRRAAALDHIHEAYTTAIAELAQLERPRAKGPPS